MRASDALSGLDKLTDRERICLRLVGRGLETKEIAIALDLSPRRVDKIIASAVAKLNQFRRKDAARLFMLAEQAGGNGSPGEPLPLSPLPLAPAFVRPQEAATTNRVREEHAPFTLELGSPLRKRGNAWNDLALIQRVIWTILLACVVFSTVGMLAFGLSILSH